MIFLSGERLPGATPVVEHRDFAVLVDGNRAGEFHMAIQPAEDGTDKVTAQANVRISYLAGLKVYRYWYRGTEIWKAGRLQRFDSSSNDDGKEFTVSAVAAGQGLNVRANGRDQVVRPDVCLTTFWHGPDPKWRNQAVPLLDADTGEELVGNLVYAGTAPMNVGGQVQKCAGYRVTGKTPWELWFDGQERLVRYKSISDGHRYELVLTSIRR
jgi:hypothetical protein